MIAACANVATSTTYRYFVDKDTLIREMFQILEERVSFQFSRNN